MASSSYSSRVGLTLIIDGLQLAVSHVGNSGLMISGPCQPVPSGEAELIVSIDERHETHKIFLPDGIPGPDRFVSFF